MPKKIESQPKPSSKSKPARPRMQPQQEEVLLAQTESAQQPKTLLKPPMLRAQRQEAAARLGRIGGNTHLGKILASTAQSTIQRDDENPEPVATQPAEETETPAEGSTAEDMDVVVQNELESFLEEFSSIEVTVHWVEDTGVSSEPHEELVTVHPPYFMNVVDRSGAARETLNRYDDAVSERGAASRAIRNFISEVSRSERRRGWGLGRALVGKSTPEDIQRIIEGALERGLIPTPAGENYPDGEAIREWLQRYGIGIDCSGFVSQALNRAAAQILGRDLTSSETLNRGSASLAGGARGFSRLEDPTELRPGDTMRIPGHIRIITRVQTDENGDMIFTTAEARAGGSADVGPDRADWRYEGKTLQIRRRPEDAWSNSSERPIFGRYNLLESAREAAEAE
jgi:cell wall-associated NlpC family hydrolase